MEESNGVPEPAQAVPNGTGTDHAPAPDASFVAPMPVLADPNALVAAEYAPMPDTGFNIPLALPPNGAPADLFAIPPAQAISAEEIALYDRQLRLWGMQVQERLRNANILLIGMKGLGNEIAKNLVLAGVGTLTILDPNMVTEDDLGTQFLVTEAQVGQNRADAALPGLQKLNPRVEIFTDPHDARLKHAQYFQNFDLTVATGLTLDVLCNINLACRGAGRKFYAADTYGMYGFIFADLIVHDFVVEKPRSNKPSKKGDMETSTRCVIEVESKTEGDRVTEIVRYQESYSPLQLANMSPLPARARNTRRNRLRVTPLLSCLRALFDFQMNTGHLPLHNPADLALFTKWVNEKHLELQLEKETLRADFLRGFLQNLGAEISPVVAFLGGYVAQDVINVIGQKEPPLQNWLLFDGEDFTASQFSIHPINDETIMSNANGISNLSAAAPLDGGVPVA